MRGIVNRVLAAVVFLASISDSYHTVYFGFNTLNIYIYTGWGKSMETPGNFAR